MHELMFQAGVQGTSERSELIPCTSICLHANVRISINGRGQNTYIRARSAYVHAHSISEVSTLESVDNFSDHLPLVFNLDVSHPFFLSPQHITLPCSQGGKNTSYTVNWERVTDEVKNKYCEYICSHLPVIPDNVLTCCDPTCSAHFKTLDDACSKLLECVKDGAKRYLPKLKQKRPAVPGWNDSARSLHKTANLWHQILTADALHPVCSFRLRKMLKRDTNMKFAD